MTSRKAYNHQKDTIGAFLNPQNGYRGGLEKKGIKPRNHMKDNLNDLRATEMKNRMVKEEESRPVKNLYKLPQFQNVESRLYEPAPEKENNSPRQGLGGPFLSKGKSEQRREELAREKRQIRDEIEKKLEEERILYDQSVDTPRKAPVPKATELMPTLSRQPSSQNQADFITRNKVEAMTMSVPANKKTETAYTTDPRQQGQGPTKEKHEEYGKVPAYLQERKQQWAEEEAEERRRRPDPTCPPGMRLMPETERLSTLQVLEQSREEALQQLRKLPFVIETPSMKRKQEILENKLREIERALDIFNKPKVYVALDR